MEKKKSSLSLLSYAIIYLVFLYVPLVIIPVFSFNDASIIAFPLSGFSTRWYEEMWRNEAMKEAALNSLWIGFLASTISTVLGVFGARAISRYGFFGKKVMIGTIMLPIIIPEIMLAVAILSVLKYLEVAPSLTIVVLGHVLICLPFSLSVLIAAFDGFDKSLEEASADLGENGFMTFFRIILPLIAPGIVSSFLLSFIISFDEFILAFFFSNNETTLPVYLWSQLRFTAKLPTILAMGTILLCLSVLLLVTTELFRTWSNRKTGIKTKGLV